MPQLHLVHQVSYPTEGQPPSQTIIRPFHSQYLNALVQPPKSLEHKIFASTAIRAFSSLPVAIPIPLLIPISEPRIPAIGRIRSRSPAHQLHSLETLHPAAKEALKLSGHDLRGRVLGHGSFAWGSDVREAELLEDVIAGGVFFGACLLAWLWWEGLLGRGEGGFGAGGVEPEEFVFIAGLVVVVFFVAGGLVGCWELAEAAGGGFGGFRLLGDSQYIPFKSKEHG